MKCTVASRLGDIAVIVAVLVSVGLSIYKATNAPITYDEAYTYLRFAKRHTGEILSDYHLPNNHILHTLAVRASYRTFGDEPWALRLPALFGGAMFLFGIAAIARRVGGATRYTWPIASAFIPIIIDFNALARGYSLGAAACSWAMWLALVADSSDQTGWRRFAKVISIGVLLAIAVGVVPTYGIFVIAIVLGAFFLRIVRRQLLMPKAIALDFAALSLGSIPILYITYADIHMSPGKWPWGYEGATEFLNQFWLHTLSLRASWARTGAFVLSGATGVSLLVVTIFSLRRRQDAAAFVAVVAIIGLITLALLRATLIDRWPFPRTLIFFSPLLIFGLLRLIKSAFGRSKFVAAILATVVSLTFVTWSIYRWNGFWFPDWRDNAGVPAAVAAIRNDVADDGATIAIAHPWQLNVCIEYELERLDLKNWSLVDADDPNAEYRILRAGERAKKTHSQLFEYKKFGVWVTKSKRNE